MMLTKLFNIIEDRKANPIPGSYTNRLMDEDQDVVLRKVGEEAIEVILAANSQGDQRLIEELADLYYHTLVLLSSRGLSLADIELELSKRHLGKSRR
jgi:phosphoribosyl-ATP pyrophosphohydrolase